jgi:hypothetical protein
MNWTGIIIGVIGLIFGFLSYRSSRILDKKLITEKVRIETPYFGTAYNRRRCSTYGRRSVHFLKKTIFKYQEKKTE